MSSILEPGAGDRRRSLPKFIGLPQNRIPHSLQDLDILRVSAGQTWLLLKEGLVVGEKKYFFCKPDQRRMELALNMFQFWSTLSYYVPSIE